MLKSLDLKNFTVFPDVKLAFAPMLNVIVGENGTGKTHVLKAAYATIAVLADSRKGDGGASSEEGYLNGSSTGAPARPHLQIALADKFVGVFRPDSLGRLVRRAQGKLKTELKFRFDDKALTTDFSFSRQASKEVKLEKAPSKYIEKRPVYLPTRELLTISPGFVSLYDTTHLSFEETWRDTCLLLGLPTVKGASEASIQKALSPLELAMGGRLELDRSGRFYLNLESGGKLEMHLVAEGLRKLAMVARLIATGSLLDKGYLFWDEPESNLNPSMIKAVANTIVQIAQSGIQVFIATHSLFLLRELHMLQRASLHPTEVSYFGLHMTPENNATTVLQGNTIDEIGNIAALDEDLAQSDRYIDSELKPIIESP